MQVRHNTSLLEEAVHHIVRQAEIPLLQAEASAFAAHQRAVGFRRLATGGAIAVAALGLGWGLNLAFPGALKEIVPGDVDVSSIVSAAQEANSSVGSRPLQPSSVIETESSPSLIAPASDFASDGPVSPPTYDFNKFQNQQVRRFERVWPLSAGHHFANDTDAIWDSAWCYTNVDIDGVQVSIDLAIRSGSQIKPHALVASPKTRQKAGLNDEQAILLAIDCPWLDSRKFITSDFIQDKPTPSQPDERDDEELALPAFVQFGSFASRETAEAELLTAQQRWSQILNGTAVRIVEVPFGNGETRYNLRVGYARAETAKAACEMIKGRGGACFAGRN